MEQNNRKAFQTYAVVTQLIIGVIVLTGGGYLLGKYVIFKTTLAGGIMALIGAILGTLYFVTHNDRDDHSERLFHNSNAVLKEFYEHFVRYYYPYKTLEEVDEMLKPFAALTVIHFANKTNQKDWMVYYVRELLLPVCK